MPKLKAPAAETKQEPEDISVIIDVNAEEYGDDDVQLLQEGMTNMKLKMDAMKAEYAQMQTKIKRIKKKIIKVEPVPLLECEIPTALPDDHTDEYSEVYTDEDSVVSSCQLPSDNDSSDCLPNSDSDYIPDASSDEDKPPRMMTRSAARKLVERKTASYMALDNDYLKIVADMRHLFK